ncbi:MAG: TetR/AcrR family transcriptional regulator [Gemmatimonadota bacterium]
MSKPRITGPERREQIIDAAIELFSTRGFSGTTTRQLAEAAGVSEAALYLHFDTKESLYEAILRRKAVEGTHMVERLREMTEEPPRAVFGELAAFVIEVHTRDQAFLRLLLYSGLEGHTLFRMFFRAQLREIAELLRAYVERQQRAGVFRPCEPRLAVRAFMGMLIHHLLIQEIFHVTDFGVFRPARAAPEFVTIFLEGLCAEGSRTGGGVECA